MKHVTHGRVVVITGASSGIGRATALKFAEHGDSLVLAARRKNLLKDLVNECKKFDGEAVAVETDVASESDVQKLAKVAMNEFGRIDVWINDAGVSAVGKFQDVKPEEHARVIETNLNGVIYGSHAALKVFKKQGRGTLINISSVLGKVTQPYMTSYAASKHGVRALSSAIRQELWLDEEEDIHVCTIFPQSIDTPFFDHEANRTGHKVKPAPPIETPEKAAEIIFEAAQNPRDEVHVGKMGKWMGMQQRLSRNLTEKQMAAFTERKHFDRNTRERPNSGNLFKTSRSEHGDIRGGWKNGSRVPKPVSAIAVAAPAAVGIYLLLKNRKSSQLRAAA